MKSVALFDFEDSFTFNIYSELLSTPEFKDDQVSVLHWSEIDVDSLNQFDVIILGPGPGHPEDYREVLPKIHQWLYSIEGKLQSFMGICLGHQMIWTALGANVERSETPIHGHTETFVIPEWELFSASDIGKEIKVQRYNSLVVKRAENAKTIPSEVVGNSVSKNEIQSSQFSFPRVSGLSLQFHPESVGTSCPNLFFRALASSYEYNVNDGSTNRRTL